jgi:Mrp family chromosome partitioning ATPase
MGYSVPPSSQMVLAGGDPYGGMGGDMMVGEGPPLRENPPEHIDTFSPDLVMLSHPDGFAAAQFRTLRHRIEQEPGLQVLVVASPREGDGRSVTAANLALALAEGGRVRVLLIDAALRNPRQHTLFGIRGDLGLTSVLAARSNDPTLPIDVIQISSSLRLLPAGPAVASAHAALSSEAAMVLIHQLRSIFNYIVVDSAAVFGTAETLAWHGLIDRYLLVARAGVTTTEDLTACCERLQREKILGVTFAGARVRRT